MPLLFAYNEVMSTHGIVRIVHSSYPHVGNIKLIPELFQNKNGQYRRKLSLNPDTSCFENSVDPDQLRSQLIWTHTVFHSTCKFMIYTGKSKIIV